MSDGPAEYTQFKYDAGNTGNVPGYVAPRTDMELALSRDERSFYGWSNDSPVVVDDTVYHVRHDYYVEAISTEDGSLRWEHNLGEGVMATPVYFDGVLYLLKYWTHTIVALDTADGSELWSYELPDRVYGGITLSDGVLYVGIVNRPSNEQPEGVFAVDAADGSVLWRGMLPNNRVEITPAVGSGGVYVTTIYELYSLDEETGELRWSFEPDERLAVEPVVAEGVVYVGTQARIGEGQERYLYALDTDDGEVRWRTEAELYFNERPIVVSPERETLYVTDYGSSRRKPRRSRRG